MSTATESNKRKTVGEAASVVKTDYNAAASAQAAPVAIDPTRAKRKIRKNDLSSTNSPSKSAGTATVSSSSTVVTPPSVLPTPASSPTTSDHSVHGEGTSQLKGKGVQRSDQISANQRIDIRGPQITGSTTTPQDELDNDQAEFQLLDNGPVPTTDSFDHERKTAPLFTRDAKGPAGFCRHRSQYGVLGSVLAIRDRDRVERPQDPRIYVNTNTPFSAVVCGVQGSGKSHTVSVLLENMLVPGCRPIGALEKALSGLVLHFGPGGDTALPCEAAWLGKPRFQALQVPTVRVYVSGSALGTMRRVYAPLGDNVEVEPLLFTESELDAGAFLSMMAVEASSPAPLYMHVILSILRQLGENYTYAAFIEKLEERKKDFNPVQKAHLDQRMELLKTFTSTAARERPRFAAGQLTIVDLTDPFIDSKSACGLFEIITRLFIRADVSTGKVLVVDEAHKYLSASAGLTEALLSLSRQMRHYGMRVIISSQEPTVVPPVLLDLCTVAILHRFSSQSWWDHVAKHFSADLSTDGAFDEVVKLKTGQAIVLAPSSLVMIRQPVEAGVQLGQLGRRYMLVKTRTRITRDGGSSIMVL